VWEIAMKKTIKLSLPDDFVGQMLDGLEVLAEDWKRTKEYLESGTVDIEGGTIRECSNAHEAERIEEFYRAIIKEIRKQSRPQA
jgi:hypothetical protein